LLSFGTANDHEPALKIAPSVFFWRRVRLRRAAFCNPNTPTTDSPTKPPQNTLPPPPPPPPTILLFSPFSRRVVSSTQPASCPSFPLVLANVSGSLVVVMPPEALGDFFFSIFPRSALPRASSHLAHARLDGFEIFDLFSWELIGLFVCLSMLRLLLFFL